LAIEPFIHTLERGLVPVSVAMIGDAANTLRKCIDSNAKPVSNSWLQRLLKRFPSLQVKSTEPLETQRKNTHDPETIRLWFSEYEGTTKQFNILRFDETGFQDRLAGQE
jgi:thiamine pyrophosphate-dependent acetolactate synthase large subunit-like protein